MRFLADMGVATASWNGFARADMTPYICWIKGLNGFPIAQSWRRRMRKTEFF